MVCCFSVLWIAFPVSQVVSLCLCSLTFLAFYEWAKKGILPKERHLGRATCWCSCLKGGWQGGVWAVSLPLRIRPCLLSLPTPLPFCFLLCKPRKGYCPQSEGFFSWLSEENLSRAQKKKYTEWRWEGSCPARGGLGKSGRPEGLGPCHLAAERRHWVLGGAEGAGQLAGSPQGGREEPDVQCKRPGYGRK